jgi:gluconolactonase
MRGSCTLVWLRAAVVWPAVFLFDSGCGTRTYATDAPSSSASGHAAPPETAVSGHSGSQAEQPATTGGKQATATSGTSASVPAPGGTRAPAMTPVAGSDALDASDPAATDAATGDAGAADGGMDGATMPMPTTPEMFPKLEAAQIGTPLRLANDHELAEGPLWDHCQKKLLFTDVNQNAMYTIAADGTFALFRMDTNYTNGITFDMTGRLVHAEMGGLGGGRVTRREKDGTLTVLADKTPRGAKFNTIDDVIVRSDGTIYFSDPVIPHGPNSASSITSKPLYRLPPGMPAMPVLEAMLALPNGVDLSPDEKVLYVAEYQGGVVARFDVAEDGSLSGRKTFVGGLTNPDSMCLDAAGNVYIGVSQGLAIVRPDGTRIKTVAMQTNKGVTNCEFGGEDGKTLYITAWQSVWKLENMPIPGLAWTKNARIACDP